MTATDLDLPVKPTETLKPVTDKVTRERAEHPDRIPQESRAHPVTQDRAPVRNRTRDGAA